jgi:LysM repeat protein
VPTIESGILVPVVTPTRTPPDCLLPPGWATYTVQPGDTLFAISLAVGSTVEELKAINCIPNADIILAGRVLFVPRLPDGPVPPFGPVPIPENPTVIGCISPLANITSPAPLQRLSQPFAVFGTAARDNFWYYKLEIRPDTSTVYNFYSDSYVFVIDSFLGEINPTLFGQGLFWLRLSVVDLTGGIQADAFCEIPLIFE